VTGTQLFAFVILPICVAALGWIAALAVEWQARHDRR